jgi:VWFA-related protein
VLLVKRITSLISLILSVSITLSTAFSQTPQKPPQEAGPDDVLRITTNLVQTNVIVVDKNDKTISDLTLDDFELYDNGKKQDLKFMEFVSVDSGRRAEGKAPSKPVTVEAETTSGITAKEVKRIMVFVIDDLTIPLQDLKAVRLMLRDFVDNKMQDGDLVAIVRVVGGKGLLQQLTTDRQLLRRAIEAIKPISHPWSANNLDDAIRIENPQAFAATSPPENPIPVAVDEGSAETPEFSAPNDDVHQLFRGMSSLSTALFVLDGLKEIPGQKNMVLITAGIPIFETTSTGTAYTSVSYLLQMLSDRAVRSGVVINTLDPRGLRASAGVVGFQQTPGRSNYESEITGRPTGFGRGGDADQVVFGNLLMGAAEHLGLGTVAKATGGVSVVNTNDFNSGMDKILARSEGYYSLAYTPVEKFDRKFHKFEIRVKRSGAKVFHHSGYAAREEKPRAARTKEEEIIAAAGSPLSRRDIDVTPNVALRLAPDNKGTVDIHLLIDANKLNFTEGQGKYQTSLDVVGFVFDQLGKMRGGFTETINLDLSPENYRLAKKEGLTYSATTDLPSGYYQVRAVVREASTGNLGTFSKYLEIPDLSKGRLAVSSLFLHAMSAGSAPAPLLAVRQVKRSQDLRYSAIIYNAKTKGGKPQVQTQLIISQAGKVLFRETPQALEAATTGTSSQVAKTGQFGLAKVPKGKYTLTLIVSDSLDDKGQKISRSIDFTVID